MIVPPWTLPDGLVTDENVDLYEDDIKTNQMAMVEAVGSVSRRCGCPLQLILGFIGPGNHAGPTAKLFRNLAEHNPTAIPLPVLMMPQEAQFREAMRKRTWPEWNKSLPDMVGLILGPGEERSTLAAQVLAGIEIAGAQHPSQRVLAEHVAAVTEGADYLGLSAAVVPLSSGWRLGHLRREIFNTRDALVGLVEKLMDKESQLAEHAPPPPGVVQRVVVVVPLKWRDLESVARRVVAKLVSKGFFNDYPNVWIIWASARFPIKGSRELHALGGRLYPLNGDIEEIARVMAAGRPAVGGPRTRLGSGYCLAGTAQQEPPTFPRAPQEPGDHRKGPPDLPETGALAEAPTDPTRPGGAASINISVTQKVTEHKFS